MLRAERRRKVVAGLRAQGGEDAQTIATLIEEGLSESSRLVDTFERAALIASAVGGVIGLVAKAQNDSYPDGRSAALDNLLALPSTLRHASQGATGR